jgi:hypothetical protein
MNTSRTLDDAPVRNAALNLAQSLPSRLIASAAGTAEDAVRACGLILTQEQLVHLKRYETHGLALPTALKDVIWYLGYERGAGPNLEARDFQDTFTRIHLHASRWTPLRTDLMNIGSELWVFADQMKVYGDGVKQLYSDIRNKPLDRVDPADQSDFFHCIQSVAALVLQRRTATHVLKEKLDGFALELSRTLLPAVQLKVRSIDTRTVSPDVRSLNDTINGLTQRIEEKQREYRALMNPPTDSQAATVDLGLYNNVKLANIRQDISELRQQLEHSLSRLYEKNRVHASLQRVRHDLQNLSLVILDADLAIGNMVVVWNGLNTYLEASVREASKIDDALSLRRLMNAFNLVAEPWETIKRDADTLLKVFKEADRAFRRDHGHQ